MRTFCLTVLAFIGLTAFAPASQDQEVPKKVLLKRVYKAGEKQDYTFTIQSNDSADIKIEGEYTLSIEKVLDNGKAEIEEKVTKTKVTFGGETMDEMDLPEPETLTYGANGLPDELNEKYDLMSILSYVGAWLPNEEVELGGSYEFKWSPSGTKIHAEGKAKLIATGRLYEERVAKIEMQIKASGDADLGTADIELTSYLNLETGKIVRIVGTSEAAAGGEKAAIEFDFRKVRS
jgi:hypothetical protein